MKAIINIKAHAKIKARARSCRAGPAVYLNPDQSEVSSPETGLPPGTDPTTTFEDSEGTFWIAAAGMIVRIKNGKAERFGEPEGVPQGAVYSLASDAADTFWLAKGNNPTGTRVVVFNHGRFEPVTSIKGLARLAAARTNGVWIANR